MSRSDLTKKIAAVVTASAAAAASAALEIKNKSSGTKKDMDKKINDFVSNGRNEPHNKSFSAKQRKSASFFYLKGFGNDNDALLSKCFYTWAERERLKASYNRAHIVLDAYNKSEGIKFYLECIDQYRNDINGYDSAEKVRIAGYNNYTSKLRSIWEKTREEYENAEISPAERLELEPENAVWFVQFECQHIKTLSELVNSKMLSDNTKENSDRKRTALSSEDIAKLKDVYKSLIAAANKMKSEIKQGEELFALLDRTFGGNFFDELVPDVIENVSEDTQGATLEDVKEKYSRVYAEHFDKLKHELNNMNFDNL